MKKLISWYLNLKLRKKLAFSYAVIILLTLILMNTFNYHTTYTFLRKIISFSHRSVTQSVGQMSYIMDFVEKELYYECDSSPFVNKQFISEGSGSASIKNLLKYQAATTYILNSQPYYQFIFYVDLNGICAIAERPLFDSSEICYADQVSSSTIREEETKLKNLWGNCVWEPGDDHMVLVKRAVYNSKNFQYLGYIVAGVSTQAICKIYTDILPEEGGFAVFDADGKPLLYSTPEDRDLCSKYLNESLEKQCSGNYAGTTFGRHVVGLLHTTNKKYSVVYLYELSIATRDFFKILQMNFLISLLTFCFAGFFAVLTSRNISQNTGLLLKQVKDISNGDFNSRIVPTTHDEIGELAQQFNVMAGKIQDLVQEISNQQTKKQQIQYQLLEQQYSTLQAQLNPHFLYNVLESISSMAKIKNAPEISKMICTLSCLLRDSINQKSRLIPLSQEVEYLKKYTALYRMMYGPSLHFVFDVPDEANSLLIPIFILQPIVENAIIHGISKSADGGTMTLRARMRDILRVDIIDNGVGIPPEKLAQLNLPLDSAHSDGNRLQIGVRSVRSRIELLFGFPYGLAVESDRQGTKITLRLPTNAKELYVPDPKCCTSN